MKAPAILLKRLEVFSLYARGLRILVAEDISFD